MLQFKLSIRIGKKKGDLSDSEHGIVVAARPAGLNITETADLLGFSSHINLRIGFTDGFDLIGIQQ